MKWTYQNSRIFLIEENKAEVSRRSEMYESDVLIMKYESGESVVM